MRKLLILLLILVVLGFGVALVIAKVNAGMLVSKSHLINPTDSPEDAKALGILIVELESKPTVLRLHGSERKVGRVWLEHCTHYESILFGFGARQVIDPEILLVMTIESSIEICIDLHFKIDDRVPQVQWSSSLHGFMKVSLPFEGEIPSAVTVTTESGNVRIEIPKSGVK